MHWKAKIACLLGFHHWEVRFAWDGDELQRVTYHCQNCGNAKDPNE